MESRHITTELENLGKSIEKAQVEEKIKNQLRDKLQKITDVYDNELQCPISYEYFSSSNFPYTIVTDNEIKTVIDAETKKDYELKQMKSDPITRSPISGYELNKEKMALVKDQEHQLDLLDNEIKQAIKNAAKPKVEKSNVSRSSFSKFSRSGALEVSNVAEDKNKIILYKSQNTGELAVKFPSMELMNEFAREMGTAKYQNNVYPKPHPVFPIVYFPAYSPDNIEFNGIFPTEKMRNKFYDLLIRSDNEQEPQTLAYSGKNSRDEFVIRFRDQAFFKEQGNVKVAIPHDLKDRIPLKSKKL